MTNASKAPGGGDSAPMRPGFGPVTVITPGSASKTYWQDVWRYRELIAFLAWPDLLVRYKQTVIGISWTILRPAASVFAYTLVFGIIAQLPSNGVPYVMITLTGLLPWLLFSTILTLTSESLVTNAQLISKIYFPRIVVPISASIVTIVDHVISFLLVFALMLWFRLVPGWQILLLPLVTVLTAATALGIGLVLAALNAHFRDFRHIIPLALQLGVFICPVGYVTSILSPKWQFIYALNPVVGIIDAFRWCVFGRADLIYPPSILITIVFAAVSLAVGIRVFRRYESTFADVM